MGLPRPKRSRLHTILVAVFTTWGSSDIGFAAPDRTALSDMVDWKLFFNQLFAMEIRKEMDGEGYPSGVQDDALREHIGYTPYSFNESIDKILEANTSKEAYALRREIFGSTDNVSLIEKAGFNASIPDAVRKNPKVAQFLSSIESQRRRGITPTENFFSSPEGQATVKALTLDGIDDIALILIPGYAAHAIKFEIFPEILSDMNRLKGRPVSRPLLDDRNGFDLKYESHKDFYGRSQTSTPSFDILHPAGKELGNTVGFNAETADLMAKWIEGLPRAYAKKKFILLGYSKGAPTIFEMLQRHPQMKSRVIGVVTFCGVVQGTNIARQVKSQLGDVLGARTIGDLIKNVRKRGLTSSLSDMVPFLAPLDLGFTKIDRIKGAMAVYGVDTSDLSETADRFINGREVRELIDGLDDLSPLTRTRWNLRYLNDDLVSPNTFVFNTSAVTDMSTFASSRVSQSQRRRDTALIAPNLGRDGAIRWKDFSLDAVFLYLSSIGGFTLAPAGLYDTQVDLQNTKTPWLDKSPLTSTLLESEIKALWDDRDVRSKVAEKGISSYEIFRTSPRMDLLRTERIKNLKPYDLGEFKGHHWSLFHQAFRAPPELSKEYAVWDFPRKAYMRALLQTIGLYRLVNGGLNP